VYVRIAATAATVAAVEGEYNMEIVTAAAPTAVAAEYHSI
jgi:hypothetical protein